MEIAPRYTATLYATLLTWFTLLTGDRWMGLMGHTHVMTVTNIVVIAHDRLWEQTPLTLFYTAYNACIIHNV